jgi:hypothetical protein
VPIKATSPEPMATARFGQMVTLSPRRLAEQPLRGVCSIGQITIDLTMKMEYHLILLTAFVTISGINIEPTRLSTNPLISHNFQLRHVSNERFCKTSQGPKNANLCLETICLCTLAHRLCLRGGLGMLGGREVKVKTVKKKHVASNPKPKDNDAPGDGLSRSQRRKAKEEAKASRSHQSSAKPKLSGLDEALEIAARSSAKNTVSKTSFQTAFAKLNMMDDDSQTALSQTSDTDESSEEQVRMFAGQSPRLSCYFVFFRNRTSVMMTSRSQRSSKPPLQTSKNLLPQA